MNQKILWEFDLHYKKINIPNYILDLQSNETNMIYEWIDKLNYLEAKALYKLLKNKLVWQFYFKVYCLKLIKQAKKRMNYQYTYEKMEWKNRLKNNSINKSKYRNAIIVCKVNKKIDHQEIKNSKELFNKDIEKYLKILDYISKKLKVVYESKKEGFEDSFYDIEFEKLVKMSQTKGQLKLLKKEYKSKKHSVHSKDYLIDNFWFERYAHLLKNRLEYRQSRIIIKSYAKHSNKIIKNEKIVVAASGDYFVQKKGLIAKSEVNNIKANVNNIRKNFNIWNELKTAFLQTKNKTFKQKCYLFLIKYYEYKYQINNEKKDLSWTNLLNSQVYKLKWERMIHLSQFYADNKEVINEQKIKFQHEILATLQNNHRQEITLSDKEYFNNKSYLLSKVRYHIYYFRAWCKKLIVLHNTKKTIKSKIASEHGKFNRRALKSAVHAEFTFEKMNVNDEFFQQDLIASYQELILLKHNFKSAFKRDQIIYKSSLNNLYQETPVEVSPYHKYVAAFLSFICPGAGQIYNRQLVKGLLMLLLIPILVFLISYAFGVGNLIGGGVQGLIDLGESTKIDQWDKPDSRYFLVEGTIAIFLIIFSLIILLICSRDAYLNGVAMQKGARCQKWINTRKYLVNQGYPLIASFPAFICLIFVILVPIISTFFIAFTNYTNLTAPPSEILKWTGFEQFKKVFSAENKDIFLSVIVWTIIWTLGTSTLSIIFGFGFAIILNHKKIVGKSFIRIIYLIPWAIPSFISILFFKEMFTNNGVFAELFKTYNWYVSPTLSKILLLLINTWLYHTTTFLMATGLMQSISPSLYESARIDGASEIKQSLKITLPILLSAMAPILIGAFVGGFNSFGIIFMLTDGGPDFKTPTVMAGQSDTLVSMVFKLVRRNMLGFAGAMNIILTAGIILIPGWAIARTKVIKGDSL